MNATTEVYHVPSEIVSERRMTGLLNPKFPEIRHSPPPDSRCVPTQPMGFFIRASKQFVFFAPTRNRLLGEVLWPQI